MACILLLFALIASAPRMTETIPKMAIAAATTPVGEAAIDAATKRNGRVFAAYIVLLIISALLIAYFTWLTWDSGNKVQDAIQGEAEARIGEATQKASEADERSKALEASNLIMRGQVATLETKAAEQQARAAKAELALLELQQRLEHRRISASDHKKMVAALRPFQGSVVNLTKLGEGEAAQFADDLLSVFKEAGWSVQLTYIGLVSPPKYGLSCMVNESSKEGVALSAALGKLPTADVRSANLPPPIVAVIFVGLKPPA